MNDLLDTLNSVLSTRYHIQKIFKLLVIVQTRKFGSLIILKSFTLSEQFEC